MTEEEPVLVGRLVCKSTNVSTIEMEPNARGGAHRIEPGQMISVSPHGPALMRSGRAYIYATAVRSDVVVLLLPQPLTYMIPAAAPNDFVYLAREFGQPDLPPPGTESAVIIDQANDRAVLVAYLLSAVRRSDWHAVSDAANDLRVLEARR